MNLDGAAAIYLRSDFRPNEKTAGTPYSECTYTRGSIPRELHRGMRGRIRPGELERESGGDHSRPQSIYLPTVLYARHFSLTLRPPPRDSGNTAMDALDGCFLWKLAKVGRRGKAAWY